MSSFWLATTGEPLPCDGPHVRLYRTGMFAQHLADHGHSVTWWSSNLNHHTKQQRFAVDTCLELSPDLELRLLRGRGYTRHVSLQRILDHRDVAADFRHKSAVLSPPRAIVAAYPTIELASACVAYGRQHGIPVALDIRDLWPDIFEDVAPPSLRWLARGALLPYRAKARAALRDATAIYAITDAYLDWGLRMAGRQRRPLDCVIPFAYPSAAPPDPTTGKELLTRLGLPPDAETICFFGTFGRQFDIPTVIEAARLLAQRDLGALRFLLCGDGDHLATYRTLARDVPSVLFPGWVNQQQIGALMSVALAGLAPYFPNRNFLGHIPNKPIEYLSAGLPILTCLNGLLEQLSPQPVGLTYRCGDAASLVDAILRLRDDPDRATMRLRARDLFAGTYASKVVMVRYQQAMENLQDAAVSV